jgi:hypothetical protein
MVPAAVIIKRTKPTSVSRRTQGRNGFSVVSVVVQIMVLEATGVALS